jgi:hypothetical protein
MTFVLMMAFSLEAAAQQWARKMFKTTNHEFGVVARGSKQEFSFEFTNIYKEDIHIASVRSSCGCTTASVTKDRLKTYEKAEVIAAYNTRSFLGSKRATITVVIDEPYYAEVQLTVTGYIRSDVVFNPGGVDFGMIEAGSGAETKLNVAYAGRSNWEILDVRSANAHFEVELVETKRNSGRVNYTMVVRLKPDAPVGYIHDQLTIVTNDAGSRNVSLPVEGQVESPLSVSPASLFLGVLEPGQKVKKMLVVKGKKAFKITCIKCGDDRFSFADPPGESKALHFVPVEFTASEDQAKVAQKITIETDLGSNLVAECVATATVKQ